MIYCCGHYLKADIVIFPLDTFYRINQKLEISYCHKHKGTVCELTFLNVKTKKYDKIRPKRKNVEKFINEVKSQPYMPTQKVKYGNKSNMAFKYGENVEKNGIVEQYSVDFNGTKNLVKTIN